MSEAPLANIRELDTGIDSGFTETDLGGGGGVDDGLSSGGRGEAVPRFGPRRGGGSPRSNKPHGNRGGPGGYIPVNNPSNTGPTYSGKVPMDVNLYATKKTVAQGMMDLALLTANANQLRYVLASHSEASMYYNLNIVLISMSLLLQVCIGIALIFLGRYNVSKEDHAKKADILNNWIVLGVFLITVINVFVSAFGIEPLEGIDPVLLRRRAGEDTETFNGTLMAGK